MILKGWYVRNIVHVDILGKTSPKQWNPGPPALDWGQKRYQKKLCDKDFAERSGELSGAICLKTLILLGNGR